MQSISFSFEPNWYNSINSFEELGLKSRLLKTIRSQHHHVPTSIQSRAILSILKAKDTIAQASSGSGKTTTIAISVLQMIDEQIPHCQAIVLTSTNEISVQVKQIMMNFLDDTNVSVEICHYKQGHHDEPREEIINSAQILIGTPDSIVNAFKKGSLKTDFVKLLALDEADQIFENAFLSEMRELFEIFRKENKDTQLALFASEIPSAMLRLSQEFMECPAITHGIIPELTLESVRQYYIAIDREEWKFETLLDLFDNLDVTQCVIFCNKITKVEDLSNQMRERGFTVSILHADLSPQQCEISSREFRTGCTRIMIMTDTLLRSRYLRDVPYFSIQYDVPKAMENYMHRLGGSGKFGRRKISISFVTSQDAQTLRGIERFFNTEIKELPFDLTDLL